MKKSVLGLMATVFTATMVSAAPAAHPANSYFNRRVGAATIYDRFKAQGVPEEALSRSFSFLDAYAGKTLLVNRKIRPAGGNAYMSRGPVQVQGAYAAIIDYSRPSSQKRLYLLNLKTGEVEKFYVAHGRNSGSLIPTQFSNVNMSKQTSLGIMLAGDTYVGSHGRSLNLYGLEPTNSLSAERDIVMHAADYVSESFIRAHGRLGLSWGCPAVEKSVLPKLIAALSKGSMIYHYYPGMGKLVGTNPLNQKFTAAPANASFETTDLPGEEEDLQSHFYF